MKENFTKCQEWIDVALELIGNMGDKKMSADKQIAHIAAIEDCLRQVKSTLAEIQPTQTSKHPLEGAFERAKELDRIARAAMMTELEHSQNK